MTTINSFISADNAALWPHILHNVTFYAMCHGYIASSSHEVLVLHSWVLGRFGVHDLRPRELVNVQSTVLLAMAPPQPLIDPAEWETPTQPLDATSPGPTSW